MESMTRNSPASRETALLLAQERGAGCKELCDAGFLPPALSPSHMLDE